MTKPIDANDILRRQGADELRRVFEELPLEPLRSPAEPAQGNGSGKPQSDKEPPRFPLVKFDDVLMSTTSIYLVKSLIPREGLVVVWGAPKSGKSFWTFDLLMHVAMGWEYRGLRVKAGAVVYCVLEGQKGFTRRIEAFRRKHPKSKGAPFYLMFLSLDLIRDNNALIASIRAQIPGGVNPCAVAIDTLNRSLVGSESSDEDMAAYIRAADAIRDAFDCVVPIIHHCGHNVDRPRGHSSLLGAVDVQIRVKRDAADNIVAMVEMAKDGSVGLEIVSQLVSVDVGKDDDGASMTSCVIVPIGEPAVSTEAAKKPKRLTDGAQIALRALREAINDLGEVPPASNHIPPNIKTVSVDQWRTYAYRLGVSGSSEARARQLAFQRAHSILVTARKVTVWEPHAWLAVGEQDGEHANTC
jgi:hypothetical protein